MLTAASAPVPPSFLSLMPAGQMVSGVPESERSSESLAHVCHTQLQVNPGRETSEFTKRMSHCVLYGRTEHQVKTTRNGQARDGPARSADSRRTDASRERARRTVRGRAAVPRSSSPFFLLQWVPPGRKRSYTHRAGSTNLQRTWQFSAGAEPGPTRCG